MISCCCSPITTRRSGIMIRMARCYGSVTRSWTAARKNGLHLPEEEASPNKQKGLDRASFGDTVMALTEYQVAETCKQCKGCTPRHLMITNQFREEVCLLTLKKMWRYGCPISPDSDGDLKVDSVEVEEEEDGESMTDGLRQVIGCPLWARSARFPDVR